MYQANQYFEKKGIELLERSGVSEWIHLFDRIKQRVHGYSPMELLFGVNKPQRWIDHKSPRQVEVQHITEKDVDNITKATYDRRLAAINELREDATSKFMNLDGESQEAEGHPFKVGDLVLVKSRKGTSQWSDWNPLLTGPLQISEVAYHGKSVKVIAMDAGEKIGRSRNRISTDHLKLWIQRKPREGSAVGGLGKDVVTEVKHATISEQPTNWKVEREQRNGTIYDGVLPVGQ